MAPKFGRKKKGIASKILMKAGGGFFFFLFLILTVFGGISNGADAPASVAAYFTDGVGREDYINIYKKVIDEVYAEKEYQVYLHELAWYYSISETHPSYEDVKAEANWIADNKADYAKIVDHFKNNTKYQGKLTTYSKEELIAFITDFKKIEEELSKIDGDNSESGLGGTTGSASTTANFQSGWYTSPKNPSSNSGYMGQCTWYVWGRANEEFSGKYSGKPAGNVRDWISQWGMGSGSTPAVNAIVVWGGGNQHVAYVESYDGTTITITEGNYNSKKVCVSYACSLLDSISFTNTWSGTLEQLKQRQGSTGPFKGFIYLK